MESMLDSLKAAKVVDRELEDISERYTLGEMLGEGRFSQVFDATRGKVRYALKAVDMATLEEDDEAVEALVQETVALRRAYAASSKHVPKLHEVVQTPEMLYVVMDQVHGCELFEMLDQGGVSESSTRRLIAQLLSALSGLHRQGVVHRDVKPENLMVSDVDDPAKCRLVMIDFGYAAIDEAGEGLTELAGSPEYAAPEVLAWLEGHGQPYTKACDLWSVGVTAYVLLSGSLPFELPDEGDLEAHVRSTPPNFTQPLWQEPSMAAARDFVTQCMQIEPSERLTAQQALKHRWFAPRSDDGQSVAIGASIAAFAKLQRRLRSLTVTDAPRRVTRWLGRLTGAREPPASPMKQTFWELKLGMPVSCEAQHQEWVAPPIDMEAVAAAAARSTLEAKRSARESARQQRQREAFENRFGAQQQMPLSLRTNATINAPIDTVLSSARKLTDRLDTDRQEEEAIKRVTPRGKLRHHASAGAENPNVPLMSPRRALFLAPSPRRPLEAAPILPGTTQHMAA